MNIALNEPHNMNIALNEPHNMNIAFNEPHNMNIVLSRTDYLYKFYPLFDYIPYIYLQGNYRIFTLKRVSEVK